MIQEGLLEYEKYKKRNEEIPLDDREYECFDNQIYNGLGELYSFNIDPKKDILSITKSIYILGSYYRNFSIKLMNISENKDKSIYCFWSVFMYRNLCFVVIWLSFDLLFFLLKKFKRC